MSAFANFREVLRSLVFRRREERELDEELQFHLEMEAAQRQRTGLSTGEALRRGALALGGAERVKEDVRDARGTRWLEELLGDIAYAARTLRANLGFSTVAVLTLAVGIGGTTAVFSAVDAVLLQPLPYQQPGRLVRLYQYFSGETDGRGFVTPVHFLAYRRQMSSFEALAAIGNYSEHGADVGSGSVAHRIRVLPATADYWDVLRARPALGRGFREEEENGGLADDDPAAAVVVLSHELWQDQFHGDPSVLGRVLSMSAVPHTVVGVMPAGFLDPLTGRVDAWVPLNLRPGLDVAQNADNHYLTVIGRLRPTATMASAQAELDALGTRLVQQYPPDAKGVRARLVPLKEDIVGGSSRSLEIMLGAVGLLLLLVCVNVASLLLVRGSERGRELALRSALGAERSRIVRQLLTESLMLALAGGIAGLIVARLAMSAIVRLGAGSIPRLRDLTLDPWLLLFSLGIASLSAVVFGTAPALRASRVDPGDVLRDQTRSTTGGSAQARLRAGFVVTQMALAFVLVVGAGLLLASFQRLREVDLGFRPEHVLTFDLNLPAARYDSTARARFYEDFAARVERIPGVVAAGGVSKLPATGDYHIWGAEPESGPLVGAKDGNHQAENRVVSADYFRALGIPMLRGRAFDARDGVGAKPPHVIISKSLADRFYPGLDPTAQTISSGRDQGAEIIGVVPDVAVNVEGSMASYVYHAHRNFAGERLWALTQTVATTGSPLVIEAEVRRVLASMDPELVMYHPAPLTDVIGRGTAERAFTLRILGAFAVVALGLAALGLFGVLSFAVTRRTREFGIRMALGANKRTIAGLVLRQGLGVAAAGLGLGVVGAIAVTRVMASLVFKVSPLDPRVIGGAAVFMAIVAASAAYLPAHRATRVDPVETLRQE